jgi:purine-binding chemotaxis protein CheW
MEPGSAIETEAGLEAAAAPQWLVIGCGGRSYAVPLARVIEIMPSQPFTRLPGTGAHVCGLVGRRAPAVTTFDLGVLLGGTPARLAPDPRLLLVEYGERSIGLLVDHVRLAAEMTLEAVRPGESGGADEDAVLGRGEIDGVTVVALATDRMLERLLT